jgi:putative acetyltransferase
MHIKIDDLQSPLVHALLEEHMRGMRASSPACSVHALDLDKLRQPDITFWTAWEGSDLLACGALKALDVAYGLGHGEVKSMRTAAQHLRKGAARGILETVIAEATHRGYTRLSLETGSTPDFAPALAMYEKFGFERCPPFADYVLDPFSVYMRKAL